MHKCVCEIKKQWHSRCICRLKSCQCLIEKVKYEYSKFQWEENNKQNWCNKWINKYVPIE